MWKIFILMILIIILQSTVVDLVEISGVIPDLRIIFIVLCSLRYGPVVGASIGFFSGFLVDIYSFQQLGAASLAGALMGYVVGLANEHVIELDRISKILLLGVAFLFHDFWYALSLKSLDSGILEFLINRSIPFGLYTLIIGAACIYVLDTDLKNEFK